MGKRREGEGFVFGILVVNSINFVNFVEEVCAQTKQDSIKRSKR